MNHPHKPNHLVANFRVCQTSRRVRVFIPQILAELNNCLAKKKPTCIMCGWGLQIRCVFCGYVQDCTHVRWARGGSGQPLHRGRRAQSRALFFFLTCRESTGHSHEGVSDMLQEIIVSHSRAVWWRIKVEPHSTHARGQGFAKVLHRKMSLGPRSFRISFDPL